MHVKFARRSRTYTRWKGKEPHRTVVVRLMEGQRHIAHVANL
jgi:hypothetical protein